MNTLSILQYGILYFSVILLLVAVASEMWIFAAPFTAIISGYIFGIGLKLAGVNNVKIKEN